MALLIGEVPNREKSLIAVHTLCSHLQPKIMRQLSKSTHLVKPSQPTTTCITTVLRILARLGPQLIMSTSALPVRKSKNAFEPPLPCPLSDHSRSAHSPCLCDYLRGSETRRPDNASCFVGDVHTQYTPYETERRSQRKKQLMSSGPSPFHPPVIPLTPLWLDSSIPHSIMAELRSVGRGWVVELLSHDQLRCTQCKLETQTGDELINVSYLV
jgi:hypothetical protein